MTAETQATATTNDTITLSFYDMYKDAGRSPELITLHGCRWLIAMLGLSLNVLLIITTIKSKNLHHRCNFLIAAEAFANGLYQLAPTTTFVLALTGIDFIPLKNCLKLQALPLFGVHMSLFCSFFIGLDRLLSIRFPLWINKQNRRRYIAFLLGVAILYGAIYVIQCYKLCEWYGYLDLEVMCTITLDCFQGLLVEAKCLYSVMAINVATVFCYICLFSTVRQRARSIAATNAKNNASYVFTQRILKSLIWITCLNIAGWCLATAARVVHPYLFGNNEFHSVLFVNAVSYLTNLTSASSGPVLYLCSEEYRKSFHKLFCFRSSDAGPNSQMSTTQPIRTYAGATTQQPSAENVNDDNDK